MKSWFSEFSYGYAVTEDIISSHGPLMVAPIFPSLQSEGKEGGYDVKLNLPRQLPLFLQFKLSDCMLRANAYEARRGFLSNPFYRMYLRPLSKSQQHGLLLDLESAGNEVYYVAPAFYLEREFNNAYRTHRVRARSVFVKPSAIGPLPDLLEHHVSFQNDSSNFGYLFSESATKVKIQNWENVIQVAKTRSEREKRHLAEVFRLTETRMIEMVNRRLDPELRIASREKEERDPARRIASLSQVFFDCTLFVVQS